MLVSIFLFQVCNLQNKFKMHHSEQTAITSAHSRRNIIPGISRVTIYQVSLGYPVTLALILGKNLPSCWRISRKRVVFLVPAIFSLHFFPNQSSVSDNVEPTRPHRVSDVTLINGDVTPILANALNEIPRVR